MRGDRAHDNLVQPLDSALREDPRFIVEERKITWNEGYEDDDESVDPHWHWSETLGARRSDIALIPMDRVEVLDAAADLYVRGIPLIHLYAGSSIGANNPDEASGLAISRLSSLLLCHDQDAADWLVRSGEPERRVKVIGSLAFVEAAASLAEVRAKYPGLPEKPYNILIVNPDPLSEQNTTLDVTRGILSCYESGIKTVWLPSNHDNNHGLVEGARLSEAQVWDSPIIVHKTIPKPDFLALLSNAEALIGNSSAMYYEAPYYGVKTLQIGERNKRRRIPKIQPCNPREVLDLLASIDWKDPEWRCKVWNGK